MWKRVGVALALMLSACATTPTDGGRVTLECTATAAGRLEACRVIEEVPAGAGFGEAALEAAGKASIRPTAGSGTVRFTTRFVPEKDDPVRPPTGVVNP
jgi:TonB family protein